MFLSSIGHLRPVTLSAKDDGLCINNPTMIMTDSFKKTVHIVADWLFGPLYQKNATKRAAQSAPSRQEFERRQHEWDLQIERRIQEERLIVFLFMLSKYYAKVDRSIHIKKKHLKKALNVMKTLPEEAIVQWNIVIKEKGHSTKYLMIEILL